MRRDWQRPPIGAYEHALTSTIVTPLNAVLSGNTLESSDLPVERMAPHGNQALGRSIH